MCGMWCYMWYDMCDMCGMWCYMWYDMCDMCGMWCYMWYDMCDMYVIAVVHARRSVVPRTQRPLQEVVNGQSSSN